MHSKIRAMSSVSVSMSVCFFLWLDVIVSLFLLKAGEVHTKDEMTVDFVNKNETYEFQNQYTCIYCEIVCVCVLVSLCVCV